MWPHHAVMRSGLLLVGLVVALLAVACASHVDPGTSWNPGPAVSASHDHEPSCHETGVHDSTKSTGRSDRWEGDAGSVPALTPTIGHELVNWVSPTSVQINPARPVAGRTHLVLAQISRT